MFNSDVNNIFKLLDQDLNVIASIPEMAQQNVPVQFEAGQRFVDSKRQDD